MEYVKAAENRDREIWRQIPEDFYSPSIHITEFNDIGINVNGYVLVAPIKKWHEAGEKIFTVDPEISRWRIKLAYWLLGWKFGIEK